MHPASTDSLPASGPLRTCEANPRYFADASGKPVLLVGSHVWSNLQDMSVDDPPAPFDWDAYLDWLVRLNHSFVRLWRWELVRWDTGSAREEPPRHHFCRPQPWPRVGPGKALDGEPEFDLDQFDPAYFRRLRERVESAGECGIYVSIMLFEGWGMQFVKGAFEAHPFHPKNNVNGIGASVSDGDPPGLGIHELADPAITAVQEAYVRQVIDTVNDLDNVLYEISNENHPASTDWQYHMIKFIHEYEATKPKQHPVGMTFQYKGGRNQDLFSGPADWVSPNPEGGYSGNPPPADGAKVVITDTDHLWGIGGNRAWVWKSFCRGLNPIFMDPYDGVVLRSAFEPQWDPIRRNMGYARDVSLRIDLASAVPHGELASTGYCLAKPGSDYVVYFNEGGAATVDLSAAKGPLAVSWLDPSTGETALGTPVEGGATREFTSPFEADAILVLQAQADRKPAEAPPTLGFLPPEPIGPDFRLRVSDNHRYLVSNTGKPFFWLGDTGWTMLTSLTEDEAEIYLEDRRRKGFNVVQCIAAHWNPGGLVPNPAGEHPFINDAPATPNDAYFRHVDALLKLAQSKGIVLALLPAWGDLVIHRNCITMANARVYGRWLGARYAQTPNLVWVLGGDQPPTGVEDIYRELAAGLDEGDGGRHLMTYHPRGGGKSSEYWHNDEWLDFNMMQSGHSWDSPNYAMVLADYGLRPIKPTLDGEPRYEHITDGLSRDVTTRRQSAHQVRKAAYNAALSGALGHTYGCSEVFRFWRRGDDTLWGADTPWEQAIDFPGAAHMGYLKALMLSRPWQTLRPDPSLIVRGQGHGGRYIPAAVAEDGQFALAYVPEGGRVAVNAGKIAGSGVRVSWYNPRDGSFVTWGEAPNSGLLSLVPPTGDADPDYVLVLDSSGSDTVPPRIDRVIAVRNPNRVVVVFSEPVVAPNAGEAGNYRLSGGGEVTAAKLGEDGCAVSLTTSALAPDADYELSVTNVCDRSGNAIAPGARVSFSFLEQPEGAPAGLVAQYTFAEGRGDTVHDSSGVGRPLDLKVADVATVQWAADGLRITAPALIASVGPATKLIDACRSANALTIEAWVTPASDDQSGPARIVSLSRDTGARNFTLGQAKKAYVVRMRTSATSHNGLPELYTPPGRAATEPAHVVYSREPSGEARLYVNGSEQAVGFAGGDLSSWDAAHPLLLANEATQDRPWLGTLHCVRLYSRAMDAAEVLAHTVAGYEG